MKACTRFTIAVLAVVTANFTGYTVVAEEKQNVYVDHRIAVEVLLIDERGTSYAGTAQVNVLFSHGEIDIQSSPYGHLSGRFAVMPPDPGQRIDNPMWNWGEKIKIPLLSAHTDDRPLYGLVYLSVGGKLVVRCHIGASQTLMTPEQSIFKTGEHLFYGKGVCADGKGKKLKIQFGNDAG